MAGKRGAAQQLTADNFDNEEEEEGPGEFARASNEELKRREFKRAKRTLPADSTSKASMNPFSTIKLFNTTTLPPPRPNPFIQLLPTTPTSIPKPLPKLTPPSQPLNKGKENSKYLKKLEALNTSVSEWITQHVKKNPHIDLTPVFEDYKKYMGEIEEEDRTEKENHEREEEKGTSVVGMEEGTREPDEEEGTMEPDEEEEQVIEADQGQKPLAIATPTEVDDGSLFNIRCKLFYKKEAEFVELGVGNLRVTNGEKGGVCLLLRNDTAMKKVLLNVLLSKGIPLSLQKNTILLVCQPNPPLEVQAGGDKPSEESDGSQSEKPNKPITYLLKVKEEQKAKELHSIIKDNL